MFGKYLKEYRIKNELTQNQAATILNLQGGDLSNIDTVTLSRWERKTTTPTIERSIRVLRVFSNDLEPYLIERSHQLKEECISNKKTYQFDILMNEKYNSAENILSKANYQFTTTNIEHRTVCEFPIEDFNDYKTARSIISFHEQTSDGDVKHGLSKIDFLNYCNQKRLIAYKYINCITDELLAHNVSAIFTSEEFNSEIIKLGEKKLDEIDLKKTVPYTPSRKLVYFAFSQHSLDEQPFRLQLNRQLKFLAKHSNITDYYTTVSTRKFMTYLESMGFSVIYREKKSLSCSVKKVSYHNPKALMHIKTSRLFTKPDFLNLLNRCQDCSNPCYQDCQITNSSTNQKIVKAYVKII